MSKQAKVELSTTKVGDSLYLLIDKFSRKIIEKDLEEELEEGKYYEVSVSKLSNKSYRCKACLHKFSSDDKHPYCAACDSEDLIELEFDYKDEKEDD